MKKYGEFAMLDKIAKDYNYTHDQVFDLSWREVITILALNNERAYIESRAGKMKRDHEKNMK